MKKKLFEHLLSVVLVSVIFIILIYQIHSNQEQVQTRQDNLVESYLELDFIDYDNPLHRTLLEETLNIFSPDSADKNNSLIISIQQYRAAKIINMARKKNTAEGLTAAKFVQLAGMYLNFIFIYAVVMFLTYYGVQTLAIFRFVKMKQNKSSYFAELIFFIQQSPSPKETDQVLKYLGKIAALLAKAVAKGILYMALFSPAYVIAYSIKTGFNTASFFFMALLGVISNGLLITYAQKFYTFLVAESRKGYVQTAIVKNLSNSYQSKGKDGITRQSIFRFRKQFPGHVFHHIYINARYQYLSTVKEQASFLISGLVIIEMALNIQGHLCYELLQNILYQRFEVVLTIILGIFLVVKATEIFADLWLQWESRRFAND